MILHQPLCLTDLVAYSFQVAVVVIVGSVLPPLLRLRAPNVRLIYWQALLAACLLLPLIEPWRAEFLPSEGAAGQVSISIGSAATTGAGWPFSLAETLLAVLLAGVLFRVIWILLGLHRLRSYRAQASALSESMASIDQARLLTSVGSPVLLSRELQSPATFGLRSPVVLLPERFFQLPASQQTAIACHELLHIARHDWTWNLLEEFILSLLWFHPALWWVVRNIRLSREQAVDAEVVRRTQSRQAYLSALLEMAQQELGRRSVPAPLFLHEGQLAQRVALMLKEVSMSRFRLVVTCFTAAAALTLTGGVAVWAFPLRVPAQAPAAVASESGVGDGISGAQPPGLQKTAPGPFKVIIHLNAVHRVDVKQLKVVRKITPRYPPEAKKAGIEGIVWLDVTVNKDGEVVVEKVSSGPSALRKSALDAVKQWRFEPSSLMPCRTRIKIHYTLLKKPSKQSANSSTHNDPPARLGSANSSTLVEESHPAPGKIYKVGGEVQQPKPVYSPDPPYTREALKAKLSGNVVLSIVVNKKGKVVSVKLVKPLGKGLDESAIKTVKTWRFKPGERDGKPVAVKMFVDITFRHDVNLPRPGHSK